MRVALHTEEIGSLLEDWSRLHEQLPQSTPFMSAAWARAWFTHLAGDAQPYVLVARDGEGICGIAPFVLRQRGPLRLLQPAGMEPGDYWDVLARRADRVAITRALLTALAERRGDWDAWLLRCPPPGSPVVPLLDALEQPALVRPAIPDPVIELPADFDTYLAGLSSNRRSNLRRHLRRLDGGEVTLQTVGAGADITAAVARWQDFRRSQWEAQDKSIDPSHLAPGLAAFVADLLAGGTALMWEFSIGGAVVGSYVNFPNPLAFHWWLGGFDPQHAKVGLGKIAIAHGIRTSIAAGRARFDFGRGAEPYKYWYGATDRLLDARVVLSGSARSHLAGVGARAALAGQRLGAQARERAARRTAPASARSGTP